MKVLIFRYILTFLILMAAVVVFILHVPIGFYLKPLEKTNSSVQLAFASGSLKSGSAIIAVVPASDKNSPVIIPGVLSWRLALERILFGEIALELLHTDALTRPVRITLSPGGIHVSDMRLRIPLGALQGLGAPFNTLKFAGYANFSMGPLEISAVGFPGSSSNVDIIRGNTRLQVVIQRQIADGVIAGIGHYLGICNDLAVLPILCTVRTLEGPLAIEGTLSLQDNLLKYDIIVGGEQQVEQPVASGDQNLLRALNGRYTSTQRLLVSIVNQ